MYLQIRKFTNNLHLPSILWKFDTDLVEINVKTP